MLIRLTSLFALPFALIALVTGVLVPIAAHAQEANTQVFRGVNGPYDLQVFAEPTDPMEGFGSRFTVFLRTAKDGQPVADADVSLLMHKPDGTDAGSVPVGKLPLNPGYYETLVGKLTTPGVWKWTITAQGTQGLGVADGTLPVREAPSAGWSGTLLWLGIVLAVIAGGTAIWYFQLRPKPGTRT